MPIDTIEPNINSKLPFIKTIRDVLTGQEAIKSSENRKKYLPKLSGQEEADYKVYLRMPIFYEVTSKATDSLATMINRKKPDIQCSEALKKILDEITINRTDFEGISYDIISELLKTSRAIVCVDRREDGSIYMVQYLMEDCIRSEYRDAGGSNKLTCVVFKESYSVPTDDPYIKETNTQYREYKLKPNKKTGEDELFVNIWRESNKKNEYTIHSKIDLTIKGQKLDFIPVKIIGLSNNKKEIKKSPISGIVNANLSHYYSTALLEHSLYWAAIPTPTFTGVEDVGKLKLGASSAVALPDVNAKAFFLEVSGNGIAHIKDQIKEKEHLMAALGAQIISVKKSAGTNLDVAKMHHSESTSTLSEIALFASNGMTEVLKMISTWEDESPEITKEIKVTVNTDFVNNKLSPQEITALLEAHLKGGMSLEMLLYNFNQGELHSKNTTIEEEMLKIQNDNLPQDLDEE